MGEWKEKPLSDLAMLYNDSWKVGDEECPYIALEHIEESKLRLNGIGHSDIVTSNKYHFNEKNFLFGKLRPYFRKVVRPQFSGICSTDIWVVGTCGETDLSFLFYLFANREFVNLAYSGSSGTKMPRADWKFMKDTIWSIPIDIYEQKAIASVLSSLDNKIDLLHRQNKTLEAMAETLFRQWFVEEDYTCKISDLITVQNGYAFKSKDFKDIGVNGVIKIKNISGEIVDIYNSDFIDDTIANKTAPRFCIETGDILFAMTGAEIGKMGIVPKTERKLWLNQRVGLFKEKYEGSRFLAYLLLKSEYGQDYIDNTATGSAQPNISSFGIENCDFPSISEQQIIDYSMQLLSLFNKAIFNLGQIRTLEKLRDTLLPKLMSGEVRVEYEN